MFLRDANCLGMFFYDRFIISLSFKGIGLFRVLPITSQKPKLYSAKGYRKTCMS